MMFSFWILPFALMFPVQTLPAMPSQPPIPPLLASHLSSPPSESLTLVSSTLSASSNWFTIRFLYSIFLSLQRKNNPFTVPAKIGGGFQGSASTTSGDAPVDGGYGEKLSEEHERERRRKRDIENVILVSYLHSASFFTDALKKLVSNRPFTRSTS